jgi:hypothetical protein
MKSIALRTCLLAAFLAASQAFGITVTVVVKSSTGGGLQGARIDYQKGSSTWWTFGTTGPDGTVSVDIPVGTAFRATYKETVAAVVQNIAVDPTVEFQTSLITVEVKSSTGAPMSGASVSYRPTTVTWPFGATGPDGTVSKELFPGNYAFYATVYYSQSATIVQDVVANPLVTFVTSAITAQVTTCAGAPISGASVTYRPPSGVAWPIGSTGAGGTVTKELFPGNYGFYATYQNTKSAEISQDVAVDPVVQFKTTKVTLTFSGSILYKGTASSPIWPFTKPSMELFAGPNVFRFGGSGGQDVSLDVTGCEFSRAMLQLVDASNLGVAGGTATPASGGSWLPPLPGQTDSKGFLFCDLDPTAYTKIKMSVNQSAQEKSKAQLHADNYTWKTATATINVKHWDGTGFAGVVIDQGGGHWVNGIATTDASGVAKVPMFPGSGTFRANWNNTAQTKSMPFPGTLVFQTGKIHSDSGNCTLWNGAGWISFVQDMEVLPATYTFRFSDGTPQTSYPISAGIENHIH